MRVPEMFSDHGMFMFLYALMEVAASVRDRKTFQGRAWFNTYQLN